MRITLRDFGLKQDRPWCGAKTRHKSVGAAEAAIRAMQRLHERKDFGGTVTPDLVPYRCGSCGFFHVGHLRPRPDRPEAVGGA